MNTSKKAKRTWNSLKVAGALGLSTVFAGGCANLPKDMPGSSIITDRTEINVDLFDGPEDFLNRARQLEENSTFENVLATLSVPEGRFERLNGKEAMEQLFSIPSVYEFRPDDNIEDVQKKLDMYSVFRLRYTDTTTRGGIKVSLTTRENTSGHNLELILIFKKDQGWFFGLGSKDEFFLNQARVNGRPDIQEEVNNNLLWDMTEEVAEDAARSLTP